MEPIIDLIWSVEEENEPDDIMMPMSANCGGTCCSSTGGSCSWDTPNFIFIC